VESVCVVCVGVCVCMYVYEFGKRDRGPANPIHILFNLGLGNSPRWVP
jgi:hypothetical protein